MLTPAILVSVLATVALSGPTRRTLNVHDRRDVVPQGFAAKGSTSADTIVKLRVGLTAKDIAGLEDKLFDVSTPGSSNYGKYLTYEEVKAYAAPPDDTIAAVTAWLSEHNITATSAGAFDDWLTFSVPVSTANTLLNTNFENFEHVDSGRTYIRTLEYSLPQNLAGHIDLVHPTTSFVPPLNRHIPAFRRISAPKSTPRLSPDDIPSGCASIITPSCIQAIYGVPSAPAQQSNNLLAVAGFIDEFANNADLEAFLSNFRTDIPSNTTFSVRLIDGGENDQTDPGVEADLDIEFAIGTATNVSTYFLSVGFDNNDDVDGFIDIIDFINSETTPQQILTTSYSFDEPDLGLDLATKMCNAYLAAGTRGLSLLFSSGDGGVSGGQSQSCTTFIPTFPSGCPFITSVGATQGINPEVVASFTGGGFSNFFSPADYQATQVAAYLESIGTLNQGLFNASGRAFPDVALQGVNFEIAFDGEFGLVDGTSCSTPTLAAIFALVNDQLLAAGKPALGFLNPFIYANPDAFTDITSGNNPGCGTNGFPAAVGWDPTTGVGTPVFSKLLTAAGL